MNNPVKDEVERQLASQMDKGIRRYGHGIILNDGHDFLQEAIEECVDQLQYLCAEKLERDMNDPSKTKSSYVDTKEGLVFIGGVTDTRVPTIGELHGLD
jgi:histidinol dehydrogenase